MTTHELPAIAGKTVETVETLDLDGNIVELWITFKDGSTLVSTVYTNSPKGYIRVRLLPARPAIVTAQTKWPGE